MLSSPTCQFILTFENQGELGVRMMNDTFISRWGGMLFIDAPSLFLHGCASLRHEGNIGRTEEKVLRELAQQIIDVVQEAGHGVGRSNRDGADNAKSGRVRREIVSAHTEQQEMQAAVIYL
jgi:hypothetical protein